MECCVGLGDCKRKTHRPMEAICEGGVLVEKTGGHVGKQSLTRSRGAESGWVVFTNEWPCIGELGDLGQKCAG